MAEKITKAKLIQLLSDQWKGMCPFVFQAKGIPENFQYDMEQSYLHFTCCSNPLHGELTMTPDQILKLHTQHKGVTPCPSCLTELQDGSFGQEGVNPDDMPLPGEDAADTVLIKNIIAPDDPAERALLEAKLEAEKQARINREKFREKEKEGHGHINQEEQARLREEQQKKQQEEAAEKQASEQKENTTPVPTQSQVVDATDGKEAIMDRAEREATEQAQEDIKNEVITEKQEVNTEDMEKKLGDFLTDKLYEQTEKLGFDPWENDELTLEINPNDNTYEVNMTCKFCGQTTKFNDIEKIVGIVNNFNGTDIKYHPCPHCIEAMRKSFDHKGIWRNTLCADRLNTLAVENYGCDLVVLKDNLFCAPNEKIKIKNKDDKRYVCKIKDLIESLLGEDEKATFYSNENPNEILKLKKKSDDNDIDDFVNGLFDEDEKEPVTKEEVSTESVENNTEDTKEVETPEITVEDVKDLESQTEIDKDIIPDETVQEDAHSEVKEETNNENKQNRDLGTIVEEMKEDIKNEEKILEAKKNPKMKKININGFELEVPDEEDSLDQESETVQEDNQSSEDIQDKETVEITAENVEALNESISEEPEIEKLDVKENKNPKNVIKVGGFEIEIEGDSSSSSQGNSLGKFKPHEKNRGRDLSDVTLAENPTHEDPLRSHIKKDQEEFAKKWYNKKVFKGEDEEVINEFVDEDDLYEDFNNSKLGQCMRMVEKRTNVLCQTLINEETYDIPIIDFNTGVRVVCLDVNNESQLKVPVEFEKQVPFRFNMTGHEKVKYRRVFLYSDSVQTPRKFKASMQCLSKIINRDHFDHRRIISLSGNDAKYALFYTDDQRIIHEFEDLNSPNSYGKPNTHQIGIIALRNTIEKKQQFTSKDILNYFNKTSYRFDMKNFNLYMVITSRYIAIPNMTTQIVDYTITDYTENAATMIKDGINMIIGAILKEHRINYPTYKANFIFEFDPASLPSPTLEILDDNGDLIPFNDMSTHSICYVRKPEYRVNTQDGFRQDERLFGIKTLSKRFEVELKRSGLNITYDRMKEKFIESLGFFKYYHPKIKKFYISPIKTATLEFDKSVLMMSKIDISKFFSGTGIYEGGYDNLLLQRMVLQMMNSGGGTDQDTQNIMNMMMMSTLMKN